MIHTCSERHVIPSLRVMEAESIHEVVSRAFGMDGHTRGRLFVTCVTKEEILVITDPRPQKNGDYPNWLNVYIPTVCGNCMGS